jgi:hypothetical protein
LLSILLCGTLLNAQDKELRDRLAAAHSQYYTPTASGLKSFHCNAAIDWKALLSRFGGTDVPDDNPALKFLRTVHLAVNDDLHGTGSLEWTNTVDPPDNNKAALDQIRDGLKTSVTGFFQSWNAYVNGSMVPLSDTTVSLTKSGDGIHLNGSAKDMTIDEDFDKNMLLTQALVFSPSLKVTAIPTFTPSPDGLLISTVLNKVHQPPTAPETEATFRIDYARVDAFQIPSRVVFDIKNTGVIEIAFNSCKVAVADAAKKP